MAGRLMLILGAGLIALWLAAAGGAALVVKAELNEVFDSILQETGQRLLAYLRENERGRIEAWRPGDPVIASAAIAHEEYITYRLYDAQGRLVLRSHTEGRSSPRAMPPLGFSSPDGGGRTYTEASADGRWVISISEPAEHREHTIRPTVIRLVAPLAALVPAALLLIPWAVRRAFAPVERLNAGIAARGGTNLAPLADPGLPPELQTTRDGVNLLLRRLRDALESERSFTANAAHELRTPVAAAMAQAELLATRLDGHMGQPAALAVVQELRRLGRRLEKLLQLARAEAGVALKLQPVDLMVPVHLLAEEFAGRPEAAGRLRLAGDGPERLMVAADLDALAIALRNLIENALVHGDPSQPVEIDVAADGTVRVANGGPVVPAERLVALRRRFVSSGGKGSGLGLSIVQAIARQMGGELMLLSPATGRTDGVEAVLRLPVVA
jgi:two-component system OmpR family sensor kinase